MGGPAWQRYRHDIPRPSGLPGSHDAGVQAAQGGRHVPQRNQPPGRRRAMHTDAKHGGRGRHEARAAAIPFRAVGGYVPADNDSNGATAGAADPHSRRADHKPRCYDAGTDNSYA